MYPGPPIANGFYLALKLPSVSVKRRIAAFPLQGLFHFFKQMMRGGIMKATTALRPAGTRNLSYRWS